MLFHKRLLAYSSSLLLLALPLLFLAALAPVLPSTLASSPSLASYAQAQAQAVSSLALLRQVDPAAAPQAQVELSAAHTPQALYAFAHRYQILSQATQMDATIQAQHDYLANPTAALAALHVSPLDFNLLDAQFNTYFALSPSQRVQAAPALSFQLNSFYDLSISILVSAQPAALALADAAAAIATAQANGAPTTAMTASLLTLQAQFTASVLPGDFDAITLAAQALTQSANAASAAAKALALAQANALAAAQAKATAQANAAAAAHCYYYPASCALPLAHLDLTIAGDYTDCTAKQTVPHGVWNYTCLSTAHSLYLVSHIYSTGLSFFGLRVGSTVTVNSHTYTVDSIYVVDDTDYNRFYSLYHSQPLTLQTCYTYGATQNLIIFAH